MNIKTIETSIESGKTRGYRITEIEDGARFLYEYAIRKRHNMYVGYYFKVQMEYMSVYEDYAIEEYKYFGTLPEAIDFIKNKNGRIDLFKPMKGNAPI